MSYLVLARKWRPQTFDEMVGQDHAVKTIRNAISADRVAHAYLFSGPRGVGKTSLARIMAKALNCEHGPTPTPCQVCSQCKDITAGSSLNVYEIDGASNRGIDEIRELKENVQYLPSSGRYKIYIIDEVHMLTKEAFNALLKTLEEPPAHVLFIFATTEAHRVPVTILSRCQKFDFRRVSSRDLFGHLTRVAEQEHIPAEPKALMAIAREAEGGVRDALSLMDQVLSYSPEGISAQTVMEVLGFVDRSVVLNLLEQVIAGNMAEVVDIVDRLHMSGHDPKQFYKNLLEEVRALIETRIHKGDGEDSSEDEQERAARKNILSRVSTQWLLSAFNQLLALDTELRYGSYPRFVIELGLFRLAYLNEFLSVDDMLSGLEAVGGTIDPPERSARPAVQPPAAPVREKKEAYRVVPTDPHEAPPVGVDPPSVERFLRVVEQESAVQATILQKAQLSLSADGVLQIRFPATAGTSLLNEEQIRALASTYFRQALTVKVTRDESTAAQPLKREDRVEQARQLRRKAMEHPLVNEVAEILGARLTEVRPGTESIDNKEKSDG